MNNANVCVFHEDNRHYGVTRFQSRKWEQRMCSVNEKRLLHLVPHMLPEAVADADKLKQILITLVL